MAGYGGGTGAREVQQGLFGARAVELMHGLVADAEIGRRARERGARCREKSGGRRGVTQIERRRWWRRRRDNAGWLAITCAGEKAGGYVAALQRGRPG